LLYTRIEKDNLERIIHPFLPVALPLTYQAKSIAQIKEHQRQPATNDNESVKDRDACVEYELIIRLLCCVNNAKILKISKP
jgi:hypothetical protein